MIARLRRLDLPTLRAALWAERALRQARRTLRHGGVEDVYLVEPPRLPKSAYRGVLALLRRREHTCLERALVLQRWDASRGRKREVIIGVSGSTPKFNAHAWLEGDPDNDDEAFHELIRLPAR